jgi:hypothetical protein
MSEEASTTFDNSTGNIINIGLNTLQTIIIGGLISIMIKYV